MFTGIVESLACIVAVETRGGDVRIHVEAADGYLADTANGDSVAVSGVCLTVTDCDGHGFFADVSAETLTATTAAHWAAGCRVNLEKALTPSKPLGGHLMSGHVDGVGRLIAKHEDARSWRLRFEAPSELARYIARKGSIAIDGVSLTVNDVEGCRFGVNIIPHTFQHTTLGQLDLNGAVNLEVDQIARYLERLLSARENS